MTTLTSRQEEIRSMQEGDDFVCPNCACEIRLRHHGDPDRMKQMIPFTCCCGTQMQKEQRPTS